MVDPKVEKKVTEFMTLVEQMNGLLVDLHEDGVRPHLEIGNLPNFTRQINVREITQSVNYYTMATDKE